MNHIIIKILFTKFDLILNYIQNILLLYTLLFYLNFLKIKIYYYHLKKKKNII